MTPAEYFAQFPHEWACGDLLASCDQHDSIQGAVNADDAGVDLLLFVLIHGGCAPNQLLAFATKYGADAERVVAPAKSNDDVFDCLTSAAWVYADRLAREARDAAYNTAIAEQRATLLEMLKPLVDKAYAHGG